MPVCGAWGGADASGLTVVSGQQALALEERRLAYERLALVGLTSKIFAGVMMIVVGRAALVPSRWSGTAVAAGARTLTWPAVLGAAAFFAPEVRAQWASARAGSPSSSSGCPSSWRR